jgi:predicted transcriptional regulator
VEIKEVKPSKLSATQLRRYMSLLALSTESPLNISMQDEVQRDLLKNEFARNCNQGLSITDKGVKEVDRLSHIAGIIKNNG